MDVKFKLLYSRTDVLYAPVAQLDRVSASEAEGHAFESHRVRQLSPYLPMFSAF